MLHIVNHPKRTPLFIALCAAALLAMAAAAGALALWADALDAERAGENAEQA